MKLDALFPSVVGSEVHTDWSNYLLPIVKEHFEKEKSNSDFYYNGKTTHGTGFDLQKDSKYSGFTEFVKLKGRQFLDEQGFDSGKVNFNPYFFLNSFMQGSNHPRHVHSQCTISGIFYLQTPEGSANLRFTPNQPFRDFFDYMFLVKDPNNYYSKSFYDYAPFPGLLLMWPAWLYHEVQPNTSVDPRISIVFNL